VLYTFQVRVCMAEQPSTPVCSRCGASDAEVMIASESVVYRYCPSCGWVFGIPHRRNANSQTDFDELQYLVAESRCLREMANALAQECRALRHGSPDTETLSRHRRAICAFHDSVRKHVHAVSAFAAAADRTVTADPTVTAPTQPSASEIFAA
jgi:hypothetical protein